MDGKDSTAVIRIGLKTYARLEKIKQKKKAMNLKETGKVGDADFDSVIIGLLDKNANNNYQPLESGEEKPEKGGGKNGKTQPTVDETRGGISEK